MAEGTFSYFASSIFVLVVRTLRCLPLRACEVTLCWPSWWGKTEPGKRQKMHFSPSSSSGSSSRMIRKGLSKSDSKRLKMSWWHYLLEIPDYQLKCCFPVIQFAGFVAEICGLSVAVPRRCFTESFVGKTTPTPDSAGIVSSCVCILCTS